MQKTQVILMRKQTFIAMMSVALFLGCNEGTSSNAAPGASAAKRPDTKDSRPVMLANLPGNPNDWPMWGRTPERQMNTPEKGVPTDWDVESGKNIKWVATLGSQSYGNPVVADG